MFLSYRHIETSQFICIANQLTGFCMTETLPINEWDSRSKEGIQYFNIDVIFEWNV